MPCPAFPDDLYGDFAPSFEVHPDQVDPLIADNAARRLVGERPRRRPRHPDQLDPYREEPHV